VGSKERIYTFKDAAIKKIIDEYTLEPGVRELERQLRSLARKATLEFTKTGKTVVITPEKVEEYLGHAKIREEDKLEKPIVGVATGLAWTPMVGPHCTSKAHWYPEWWINHNGSTR